MPDPALKLRDKGNAVTEAQDLLNRSGALLDADGDFGNGTLEAVREFQTTKGLAVTGIIDAATWKRLRRLRLPSADIPTRAVAFIGREEVSSRKYYDARCVRPTWPGGASGVTIGVGYDIGYQQATFKKDWAGLLSASQTALLTPWLGIKGDPAKAGPPNLTAVTIPWQAAWKAFIVRTLPQQVAATRKTFVGPVSLPPLCLGVLVSLVYNRGTSMTDSKDFPENRKEMRMVRDAVASGNLDKIPAALRAMKRLWKEGNGLRDRRDREARLFEEGLK